MAIAPACRTGAGLLSARSSSAATGQAESATGTRLEKLVRSGVTGPIVEALATYKQDLENIQCASFPRSRFARTLSPLPT